MTESRDNLMDLLLRFHEPEEARRVLEEMERGDALLRGLDTIPPDPAALARLKSELAPKLTAATRRRRNRRLLGVFASAAAVMLLGAVAFQLFQTYPLIPTPIAQEPAAAQRTPEPEVPAPSPWHIESDEQIAQITSELESVVDDILDVPVNEYAANRENPFEAIEKEIEALASRDNFWGEYYAP